MKKVKVGINGFGRIGRQVFRALHKSYSDRVEVVAINDLFDAETNFHLAEYDSVYGRAFLNAEVNGTEVSVGDWNIHCFAERDPKQLAWGAHDVDVVVESTGIFRTAPQAGVHLDNGAKKVIITAPAKEEDITIVMGVNQDIYDPAKHAIISAASCTTNCLAPAVKVVHENFGFRHGLMTTIHSYTMSQRILDGSHKDWRRGRAAAVSMVPCSTGAAKAVGVVMPELEGRINGMSVRVPTFDCSLVDLTCEVEKACDAEAVNAALKAASRGALCDNMGFSEEPLVSIDYRGSTYGGVVDALSTQVLDQSMVKLLIWYDNEAGFTNQLLRLLRMVGKDC